MPDDTSSIFLLNNDFMRKHKKHLTPRMIAKMFYDLTLPVYSHRCYIHSFQLFSLPCMHQLLFISLWNQASPSTYIHGRIVDEDRWTGLADGGWWIELGKRWGTGDGLACEVSLFFKSGYNFMKFHETSLVSFNKFQ